MSPHISSCLRPHGQTNPVKCLCPAALFVLFCSCVVFHYERRAKQLKTCHGTCLSAHFLPPTVLLWAVTYIYLHLFGYNVALKWKPSPPSVWGFRCIYRPLLSSCSQDTSWLGLLCVCFCAHHQTHIKREKEVGVGCSRGSDQTGFRSGAAVALSGAEMSLSSAQSQTACVFMTATKQTESH